MRKCSVAGLLLLSVKQLLIGQVAFVPAGIYPVSPAPKQVVATDVNADGKPDIISASYVGSTLTVLTNDGRGNFKIASTISSYGSECLGVADFNNDSRPDVVAGNTGPETISVFTNQGKGIFALASTAPVAAHPVSLIVADINNDGRKDVVVGNYNNATFGNYVTVLTNNGTGIFSTASSPSINGAGYSVAAADLNEDGWVDILSAGTGYLTVLTNKGGGQFQAVPSPPLSGQPQKVVAADVSGDGHVDLVTANSSDNTLSVVTNDGGGHFTLASLPMVSGESSPYSPLTAADIDNDGRVDLITGNIWGVVYDNTISVLTNAGSGGFALASEFSAISPRCVATADFNADGKVDLVAADGALSKIRLFLNAPTLSINPTNNNVVVSWLSTWTNWVLHQNSDLATPNWTASSSVFSDGTNSWLTVEPESGSMFYRLVAP